MVTRTAKKIDLANFREPPGTPAWQVKQFPPDQLLWPFPHVQPFPHQKISVTLGCLYDQFLFALDTGLGKTLIVLAIFAIRKQLGQVNRMLVVLPFSEYVIRSWKYEVTKHKLPFSVTVVSGPTQLKHHLLWSPEADIVAVSARTLLNFTKKFFVKEMPDGFLFNVEAINTWASNYQMVVFDECHFLTSPRSKSFKFFYQLFTANDRVHYRYFLSATPSGDKWLGIWAIYKLLDDGKTFGSSYVGFLQRFFKNVSRGPFPIYVMRKERTEEFRFRFWQRAVRFEKSQELQLPDRLYVPVFVGLLPKQRQAYEQALLQKPVNLAKLRRIVSGIVDGEFLLNSPKVEALLHLVQETVNHSGQLIIWHWLVGEAHLIEHALKKNFPSLKLAAARAEISDFQKRKALADWHKGKCQVLIANPASLGQVVTLTETDTAVYFSNPDSYVLRYQSEDRIYRIGQTKTCWYFDLIAEGTVDEQVWRSLQKKQDAFAQMTGDQIQKQLATLWQQKQPKES